MKCFPSVHIIHRKILKTEQVLDLCLRKPGPEKSHNFRDFIVFKKLLLVMRKYIDFRSNRNK